MTVDNESVFRTYSKPPNSDTKFNGILWHSTFTAKTTRLQEGRGSIKLRWMNSHKSLENSVRAGIPAAQWAANSIADKLAGKAAAEAALSPIVIAER